MQIAEYTRQPGALSPFTRSLWVVLGVNRRSMPAALAGPVNSKNWGLALIWVVTVWGLGTGGRIATVRH